MGRRRRDLSHTLLTTETWTEDWQRTYPALCEDEPYFTLELIPHHAGGINLRTRLKKEGWNRLRKAVYKGASYRCQLCGEAGDTHPVECHEIWEWLYERAIPMQKLHSCAALCPKCHQGKHLGLTKQIKTQVQYERVIRHICHLNGWTRGDFTLYLEEYLIHHTILSNIPKWRLNIAWAREKLKEMNK